MNIIEFIYAIISKYAPITQARVEQLKAEANEWYASKVLNDANPTGVAKTVKQYGEEWYFKTFLAIAFLYCSRLVSDFMNPEPHDDEF